MTVKLVRIRPYNPRIGCKVRSYTMQGVKFKEDAGWYTVEEGFAAKLVDLYQVDGDPMSGLIFDVMDPVTAQQAEERERAAKEKASARAPVRMPESSHKAQGPRSVQSAMTTADLVAPKPRADIVGRNPVPEAPAAEPSEESDDWGADLAESNEAPRYVPADVAAPTAEAVAAKAELVVTEPAKPARLGPPTRLVKPRG